MPNKYCPIPIYYSNQSKQNVAFLIDYDLEAFLNILY